MSGVLDSEVERILAMPPKAQYIAVDAAITRRGLNVAPLFVTVMRERCKARNVREPWEVKP